MDRTRIIDLKKTVLLDNDADADKLRQQLKESKVFYINIMSSPGSGKTSTILKLIDNLKDKYRIGVMEADIDSDVDARTVADTGVTAVQLHTGGMCHLDAEMSRQGMRALAEISHKDNDVNGLNNLNDYFDIIILENVGNLVCPAEFDAGAVLNLAILSVPEGDDKPLKYPLMFQVCQGVVINKIDSMPAFDFNLDRVKDNIKSRRGDSVIFPISARTGEGVDALADWIDSLVQEWKK